MNEFIRDTKKIEELMEKELSLDDLKVLANNADCLTIIFQAPKKTLPSVIL